MNPSNPLESLGYINTDSSLDASTRKSNSILSSLYQRGNPEAQNLLSIARKVRPDAVKLSHFLLKRRMSESLDNVIQKEFKKNPALKDNIHIGIMTDDNLSVEVISKQKALDSVQDMDKEQASEILNNTPVGYYASDDFQIKTPDNDAHQSMKRNLETFFKKNLSILQYLREHPENDIDLQDLIQP
ncbi:hypothetical protein AB751O23_AD_00300 [Chlamydiales bacterium SCGC AB-751-O23]|jgi:hypothetical protein|nr:hypothetical protein AB751O23_AD_00300 [Chlamydiales bacterium SCGC AB-751-O23]